MLAECRTLGSCATGDAKITLGYRLSARYVIHTVGPIWHGGGAGEDAALGACYRRSLQLCEVNGLATVAFPAISTGVYGFPAERAADIAIGKVIEMLPEAPGVTAVTFCCFSESSAELHLRALADLAPLA